MIGPLLDFSATTGKELSMLSTNTVSHGKCMSCGVSGSGRLLSMSALL